MKRFSVLIPVLLHASVASAADLQAAADDICECFKEPYALVEQALADLQAAQASGDYMKLAEAQGEMMGVMSATASCFEALPARYPEINQSEELKDKVMALVDQQCPNPAAGFMPGQRQ